MHECKHTDKIYKIDVIDERTQRIEEKVKLFDEKLDKVLSWKYTVRGGLAVVIFVIPLYVAVFWR